MTNNKSYIYRYAFDEFQTSREKGSRRPVVNTLYDVVCNICADEKEHVSTMATCQDPSVVIRSPNTEAAVFALLSVASLISLNIELLDANTFLESISSTANNAVSVLNDLTNEAASSVGVQIGTGNLVDDVIQSGAENLLEQSGLQEALQDTATDAILEKGMIPAFFQLLKSISKIIF